MKIMYVTSHHECELDRVSVREQKTKLTAHAKKKSDKIIFVCIYTNNNKKPQTKLKLSLSRFLWLRFKRAMAVVLFSFDFIWRRVQRQRTISDKLTHIFSKLFHYQQLNAFWPRWLRHATTNVASLENTTLIAAKTSKHLCTQNFIRFARICVL